MKPGKVPPRAWDTGIMRHGGVRAQLGASPKPSPPNSVPGAEALPNPVKNGSGFWHKNLWLLWANWGGLGAPLGVRTGCKAWAGAGGGV